MGMDEWLKMYPPEDKDADRKAPGRRPPVSKKRIAKMASQKMLDLHGLTVEEARSEVEIFLVNSKRNGLKKVLIIHGKGYHSQGQPVLKGEVYRILKLSPLVGEYGQADRTEGGSGAVWVLIK